MKIIKIILILVGIFILYLICRSSLLPALDRQIYQLTGPKNLLTQNPPDNQEACLAQGGDWAKAGLFPKEVCRIPAQDAGKFCLAGFQCQFGTCLAKGNLNLRNPAIFATGVCARYYSTFGCTQSVSFGLTHTWICRD